MPDNYKKYASEEDLNNKINDNIAIVQNNINTHIADKKNPHNVTAAQVGAAPAYTYSNTDLTAGTTPLTSGKLHFVYE